MLLLIPGVRKTVHSNCAIVQGMPVMPMILALLPCLPLYLPFVLLPMPVPSARRRSMLGSPQRRPTLPSHRLAQADSAHSAAVLIGIRVSVLRWCLWL